MGTLSPALVSRPLRGAINPAVCRANLKEERELAGQPCLGALSPVLVSRPLRGCSKSSRLLYSDGTQVDSQQDVSQYVQVNWEALEKVEVKGSLANHLKFWKALTDDRLVLGIIENSYHPPFTAKPLPFFKENNKTAKQNSANFNSPGYGVEN